MKKILAVKSLADITGQSMQKGRHIPSLHFNASTFTAPSRILDPPEPPPSVHLKPWTAGTNLDFHTRIPRLRSVLNTYLSHRERKRWLLHTRIIENDVRTEITDWDAVSP